MWGVWTTEGLPYFEFGGGGTIQEIAIKNKNWTANENKGGWLIQQRGYVACQLQEIFYSEFLSLEKF